MKNYLQKKAKKKAISLVEEILSTMTQTQSGKMFFESTNSLEQTLNKRKIKIQLYNLPSLVKCGFELSNSLDSMRLCVFVC